MNNINELLNLKRRLIALSLAGSCLIGLTGCGNGSRVDDQTTKDKIITESNLERMDAVVQFFEDYAVITYATDIYTEGNAYSSATTYLLWENNHKIDTPANFQFPANNSYVIRATASFTPEEFVIAAKGPDFPINYLNNDEKLSR